MKNNEIELTIIIPVYNVENYLEKCVNSVIPSIISYEVILVDDGSTDNSPALCEKLAKQNQNIKVIHKINGGLSSARNAGLNVAKGKYVAFIDSDDWIEKGAYDNLIKEMDNGIDILKYSYVIDYGENIVPVHNILNEGIYEHEQIAKIVLPLAFGGERLSDSTILKINLSVTSNIYRLDFLKENRLEFISEREVGSEDFLFNIEALICCQKIQVIDKTCYHYVQRIGSLTKQYRIKLYEQYKKLCEYLYDYMNETNALGKYLYYYRYFYCCLMYLCIWNECNEFAPGNKKDKLEKIDRVLDDKTLQQSICMLKTKDLKSSILKYLIKFRASKILYSMKSS